MEFLEMPYEPVAFRFYSLAASSAGGPVLTCLAVLAAAAVGFWRMRAVGSRSDGSSLFNSSPSEDSPKKAVPEAVLVREAAVRSTESEEASPVCVDTPKTRFMAYFKSDDSNSIGCCHVEEEDEEELDDGGACEESDSPEVRLPCEKEEEVEYWTEGMSFRKRDLGWYSYQDMQVLNGSVVRLWEGESSPRRRRRTGGFAISSF